MTNRLIHSPVHQASVATGFKTASHDGREYLIVPGVPAKEQVMNAAFVPGEELAHFLGAWNGVPITIRHPKANSGSANAPEPDVAIVGRFYNARWDDNGKRLTGEYWLDVTELQKWGEGMAIENAVRNGQMLETSTGYWADDDSQPGQFLGVPYNVIHRNLRPDHIAILPDEVGACSLADGCGVNRNQKDECKSCAHHGAQVSKNAEKTPMTYEEFKAEYMKDHPEASEEECKIAYEESLSEDQADENEPGEEPTKQNVTGNLPEQGKRIWESVYQKALDDGDDKETAAQKARGAVKKAGWSQDKQGKWVKANAVTRWLARVTSQIKANTAAKAHDSAGRVVSNHSKENSMKWNEFLAYLSGKGIQVKANSESEEEEPTFDVSEMTNDEEEPEPKQNAAALSDGELAALRDLAKAAPALLAVQQNAARHEQDEKSALVAEIKANRANVYSDDELAVLSVPMLTKLNAQLNVNYAGLGGARYSEPDFLGVPSVLLAKPEKEA